MASYEYPWIFDGKEIDDEDVIGYEAFVYLIVNKTTGRKYIGVKKLISVRKQKGKTRRQKSASDWKSYWSSSESLKACILAEGKENFERTILSFHLTFGDARFNETKLQFQMNVLESDQFYNDCIGKYRRTSARIAGGRKFSQLLTELLLTA